MSANVKVVLSDDEALVLFDWLVRFNKREGTHFADQSEQRVLWDIECMLEKQLVAPLSPNYRELLDQARANVRDSMIADK
ncbi:MAG: hypothetical protein M4D80_16495 [Myxococcota bacterium]|nr:hypothetical protein [Myxococcota bacterium]